MKLLALGDSFTVGAELKNPSRDCYPALIANENNWQLTNLAIGGASNDKIIRLLFENIDHGYDVIIIGWTYPDRMEVNKNSEVVDPVDISPTFSSKIGYTWALEYYAKHYNRLLSYKKHWTEVVMLQSYLKLRGQKYIFCNITGLQSDIGSAYNDYIHELGYIFDQIDLTHYIDWPKLGMVEWAFPSPKGPGGHFLEEGHRKVAERINEHIRNIGCVS